MSALTPAQLAAMETFASTVLEQGVVIHEDAIHAAIAIRMLAARVRELEGAVAAEREVCARLCDARADSTTRAGEEAARSRMAGATFDCRAQAAAARSLAAQIRARGER